jgi:hypothetical protein
MTAHAEVSDVVKEDNPRNAALIGGFNQECANDDLGAPWLIDDRGSEVVMLFAEEIDPFGQAALAEVGST